MKAIKRMIAARSQLILDQPFYGVLALKLKLAEDPGCGTAWVDGVSLGFDPAFIDTLKDAEVTALVTHEVMHCASGHPWRRDGREMRRWNNACDRSINPIIRDAGGKLPEGALYALDDTHKGRSAEWIYDRLPTPQGRGEGSSSPSSGSGTGPQGDDGKGGSTGHQSNAKNGPAREPSKQGANGPGLPSDDARRPARSDVRAQSTPSDEGQGDGAGKHQKCDPLGEVRDAPIDGPEDASETSWQQAAQQAAQLAKGHGQLPGALKRFAKDAARPRIDWRSALRRFVQEQARSDYSFARPNSRYVASGMILPALRNHEVGIMAVAVDTSGSIDSVMLSQFQAEIRSIVDEVHPKEVRVLYVDACVAGEETFCPDDVIELHPAGGGGTNFAPAFARVDEWDEPPVCFVYLTDMCGDFPAHAPEYPVLWMTTSSIKTAPFGEVLAAED